MSAAPGRMDWVAPPDGVGRLLALVRPDGQPASHQDHVSLYGPLVLRPDLVEVATASGLRGRGGGAFPIGEKLRAVQRQGGRPVVVVNGTEGEPASRKDKALLGHVPHLVLDGAVAAAAAVGAKEVVVAVGHAGRRERAVLAAALEERSDPVRWRLGTVPDGFVVGEETALLAALSGRAPKPTVKPPYPFERGLGGAPTLVQNAETLAHLALIARFGSDWFRARGTSTDPGTTLVTLSGAVSRPGVYEVEVGTRLSSLVAQAGGLREPVDAYLVGGYFGAWTRDGDVPLSASDGLGAGVVVAFPSGACAISECARVARYLAGETAGQCGPCVHGLAALAGGLEQIAAGPGGDRIRLARWAKQVAGRGACRHPDGAARFVTSALAVFEQEAAEHLRHAGCGRRDRAVLALGASHG